MSFCECCFWLIFLSHIQIYELIGLTDVRTIVAERNSEDNRPVLIMAEDECRFGRISDSRSAWAPAGFCPVSAR